MASATYDRDVAEDETWVELLWCKLSRTETAERSRSALANLMVPQPAW